MERKLLKTNEAAQYLGVSRSSLANWIRQGLISGGATPGGHYRFTIEELNAFAKRRGLVTRSIEEIHSSEEETEAETQSSSEEGKTAPENTSYRLLVVDDDEAFREFVRDAMEEFTGYELREASDGMTGAMMIGSWKPQLVILDIRMPSMNGTELLRLVRQDPDLAAMKIIVASAHLSDELRQELQEWTPNLILEKPLRLARLVASIQNLLNLPLSDL